MPSADFLELYTYIDRLVRELSDYSQLDREKRAGVIMIWNKAREMLDEMVEIE